MQKLEKMYCPSCGAPISFEDGRDDTFCSHCGHQIFKEDSQLEEKNRHEERKWGHEENLKANETKDAKYTFIFVIACFVFCAILLVFMGMNI